MQDDIQEAAAVMVAGAWYASDSQSRLKRPMGSSEDVLTVSPSPSNAEDEVRRTFSNFGLVRLIVG